MAKQTNGRSTGAKTLKAAAAAIRSHFVGLEPDDLITASRQYPVTARVDLQRAMDEVVSKYAVARQLGIHAEYAHETLTLGHLLGNHHSRVAHSLLRGRIR